MTAVDRDSDQHSNTKYKLQSTSNDEDLLFSVDSQTGDIATKTSLDREERHLHKLIVVAYDRRKPTMSKTSLDREERHLHQLVVVAYDRRKPTMSETSLDREDITGQRRKTPS